jgi:hypothetical protein
MSIPEAAANHKIKVEALQNALGGKKKKNKDTLELKGAITRVFRSRGTSLGALTRKIMERFEDGDMSWKTVVAILDHYDKCCKGTVDSAREFRKRLEARNKSEAK